MRKMIAGGWECLLKSSEYALIESIQWELISQSVHLRRSRNLFTAATIC